MAVKYGSSPQPAAASKASLKDRCFLNCLETSHGSDLRIRARGLPALPAKLRSKAGLAEPKHHGSEVRIGPAAGSPYCQTLLSELPRTSLRPSIRPPSCTASKAPLKGPVSQSQNTMAVKYGSGPAASSPYCQTLLSELPRN